MKLSKATLVKHQEILLAYLGDLVVEFAKLRTLHEDLKATMQSDHVTINYTCDSEGAIKALMTYMNAVEDLRVFAEGLIKAFDSLMAEQAIEDLNAMLPPMKGVEDTNDR